MSTKTHFNYVTKLYKKFDKNIKQLELEELKIKVETHNI